MKASFLLIVLVHLVVSAQESPPRVFLIDTSTLQAARDSYIRGGEKSMPAIARLLEDAKRALSAKPVSVLQKTQPPPSGDMHDYTSLAPYWWPDSSKPDGLPYIRRDGEVNPEHNRLGDRARLGKMMSAVCTLSLAFYITREERYAEQAVEFLRTWFLNPDTRMNPNLQFAQIVRGRDQGRGIGIIDAYGFRGVVDAIGLLAPSRSWTAADQAGMKQWFGRYLDWLLTSDHGKQESTEKNNHGTAYAVQVATIALFLGRDDLARGFVQAAKEGKIAKQIEPDGSQPLELARTKSWNYSMMNLEALMQLAWLGDRLGVDLWSYRTQDGRSLRKAIDYLLPAALGREQWKKEQITRMEVERMYNVLTIAAIKYKSKEYAKARKAIPRRHGAADRANLTLPALKGDD
jgi:hypothetical protein